MQENRNKSQDRDCNGRRSSKFRWFLYELLEFLRFLVPICDATRPRQLFKDPTVVLQITASLDDVKDVVRFSPAASSCHECRSENLLDTMARCDIAYHDRGSPPGDE